MNDFNTLTLTPAVLDPHKRVKYTNGLVLGVDEFNQEQYYLLEKDRGHDRGLHGFGTVNGLRVTVETRAGVGPEVVVAPGLAIDRHGREICVPATQCAPLNAWLARHAADLPTASPPRPADLYVVLCYDECQTDTVPIPGGPCRSEADSIAPSRVADSFRLSLQMQPPQQPELTAERQVAHLLSLLEVTDSPDAILGADELASLTAQLVGAIDDGLTPAGTATSGTAASGRSTSSPPAASSERPAATGAKSASMEKPSKKSKILPERETTGAVLAANVSGRNEATAQSNMEPNARATDMGSTLIPFWVPEGPIYVHETQVCALVQGVLRAWATQVRPTLLGGNGCLPAPADEGCILLAKLTVSWDTRTQTVSGDVTVNDAGRPYLLSSAMLQEIVLCGGLGHHTPDGPAGGDLTGSYPNPTIAPGVVTSEKIADGTIVNADISPTAAIAYGKLNLAGSIVNADIAPTAAIAYSKLNLGNSIVTGDLKDGAVTLPKINAGGAPAGTAITFDGANVVWSRPTPGGPAGGDLVGTYPNPQIGPNTITSAKILDGTIVNADISPTAAITYSKLNLTNSIGNADIGAAAAIAYTKLNLNNSIVTGDLKDAAVTLPKISPAGASEGQVITLKGAQVVWAAPTGGGTGASVTTNSTIIGNGTASNPLGVNLANANTWTATQALPVTAAQGDALIAVTNSATTTINAARIGAGLTDAQVNDNLTINGGTVNNTPIGATTPSTGAFTMINGIGLTLGGKATSAPTLATDPGNTLVTKDFVLAQQLPCTLIGSGYFDANGAKIGPVFNGLTVSPLPASFGIGMFLLTPNGYTVADIDTRKVTVIVQGVAQPPVLVFAPGTTTQARMAALGSVIGSGSRYVFEFICVLESGLVIRAAGPAASTAPPSQLVPAAFQVQVWIIKAPIADTIPGGR